MTCSFAPIERPPDLREHPAPIGVALEAKPGAPRRSGRSRGILRAAGKKSPLVHPPISPRAGERVIPRSKCRRHVLCFPPVERFGGGKEIDHGKGWTSRVLANRRVAPRRSPPLHGGHGEAHRRLDAVRPRRGGC